MGQHPALGGGDWQPGGAGLCRARRSRRLASGRRLGIVAARAESAARASCRVQRAQRPSRNPTERLRAGVMAVLISSIARRGWRAAGRWGAILFLVALAPRLPTLAATNRPLPPAEYQVKAVFLFNFAQFVEW